MDTQLENKILYQVYRPEGRGANEVRIRTVPVSRILALEYYDGQQIIKVEAISERQVPAMLQRLKDQGYV